MKKITLLIITFLFTSYAFSQISRDSLFAEYLFNANYIDVTGNGNDGTNHGASFVKNRFDEIDGALNFNDTIDYVDIGNMDKLSTNLENNSISFWMKSDTIGKSKYETVMKTINDGLETLYSIEVHRGTGSSYEPGVITYQLRDDNGDNMTLAVKKTEIFDNNWHHIVFVVDSASSNKGHVYIDNQITNTIDSLPNQNPSSFSSFDHPLVIGAANNRGTIETPFNGSLDDIRFYNRSLSNTEVNELYNETGSITSSIEEKMASINVYPNPTEGMIYINSPEKINSINILDITGKIVLTTNQNSVNISSFESGIFFLQINTDNRSTVSKILKK